MPKIFKKIGKKAGNKKPERNDWEINQQIISDIFWEALLTKSLKMPSYTDVAKKTGLSVRTVERHVEYLDFEKHFKKFRCVESKMMIIFMNKVMKSNNHNMWETYWNLTNPKFAKKQALDVTSQGEKIVHPTIIAPGDEA